MGDHSAEMVNPSADSNDDNYSGRLQTQNEGRNGRNRNETGAHRHGRRASRQVANVTRLVATFTASTRCLRRRSVPQVFSHEIIPQKMTKGKMNGESDDDDGEEEEKKKIAKGRTLKTRACTSEKAAVSFA